MAGLCEGGNEPPGSLKASKEEMISLTFVVAQTTYTVLLWAVESCRCTDLVMESMDRVSGDCMSLLLDFFGPVSFYHCVDSIEFQVYLGSLTRLAPDPELCSGLGWIPLWSLVSSEVFHSRGTEAGWSMASPLHQTL
ncbi:hypothetical protein ANN_20714 [Periplaneta americana]|uniref:Uncharacterized protein n=1 Tax=Periplaneta americana TaxID=6978 RepID=A0ABQ8SDI9_PERAM|nr:hypothetical protein ANN_20714 [Periplaneta americana]